MAPFNAQRAKIQLKLSVSRLQYGRFFFAPPPSFLPFPRLNSRSFLFQSLVSQASPRQEERTQQKGHFPSSHSLPPSTSAPSLETVIAYAVGRPFLSLSSVSKSPYVRAYVGSKRHRRSPPRPSRDRQSPNGSPHFGRDPYVPCPFPSPFHRLFLAS
jgi:hypothetical protein